MARAVGEGAAGLPGAGADELAEFPELDCVRGLLPAPVLGWAADRADRLGTGADRVLIAAGLIGEEAYLRALSRQTGIAFEPLDRVTRGDCPLDDKALLDRAATGLLPVSGSDGGPGALVVAPRGLAVRALLQLRRRDSAKAARFRLTSAERFNRFVLRAGSQALTTAATADLAARWPMLSARRLGRGWAIPAGMIGAVTAAAGLAPGLAPAGTWLAVTAAMSAMFLGWIGLRLAGAVIGERAAPPAQPLPDRALPDYSVIVALYREARSVPGLLAAIERFDYPGIMAQTPQAF